MHAFESKLAAQLATHDWRRVTSAVAVSGGADSVALLRALAALRDAACQPLAVLHFNHRLRGADADADAAFVESLAVELGLKCLVGQSTQALTTRGDSLESAARDARYAFFVEATSQLGARYLFAAHTADDQAETILHRILRGTGVDGLAGIPSARALSALTTLARPMLAVRRAEVLQYLGDLEQPFRQDATNADLRFTRNRLRHDLLPKLAEQYNPNVHEALVRLGNLAAEASACLEQQVDALLDNAARFRSREVFLDVPLLVAHPDYLVRQLLIRIWQRQAWPLQAMTFDKWQQLAALIRAGRDDQLNLPGDIQAKKQGEQLLLTRPGEDSR